ncbi:LOW QUALITY PROTEIN: hypothetical protein HID58_069471, partial [Brassica napus]
MEELEDFLKVLDQALHEDVEEADGFHKRLKMIHDPVKSLFLCAISKAESPIPPDISVHQDHKIGIVD